MRAEILKGLKEILFPLYCFTCKTKITDNKHFSGVCYNCIDAIKYNKPPFCYTCGAHTEDLSKARCKNCSDKIFHCSCVWSACLYEGVIKELLTLLKYDGYTKIAQLLGKIMIDFIENHNVPINEIDLIMPIPLYKRKLREREFNQAELLANIITKHFNKELSVDNLVKIKDTQAQALLDKQTRLNNLKDTFQIKNSSLVKNRSILIIDDVLTTGTTCSEAAKTLKESGANLVLALSLAQ